MDNTSTVVDRIVVPHEAFTKAVKQLDQLFYFAQNKDAAEGAAILGESGAGKTTLLQNFVFKHKPHRNEDGMEVPVLFASVPSTPTVRKLAGEMLRALGAPDWDGGSELQMTRRLQSLMPRCNTHMVIIDEFNHFYDRGKNKIMYNVADWLKKFIDDTRTTLVVSGLPACRIVINQNEQLARRFLAPIEMPRFDWQIIEQRQQFIGILAAFYAELSKNYQVPSFHTGSMAFRFYCATGGLIGYLSKLLRQAERNAAYAEKKQILIEDLNNAHREAVWSKQSTQGLPQPFALTFQPVETVALLVCVGKIGTVVEPAPLQVRRPGMKRKGETINARLIAS